jgi:peptidoglycan hydrolase-like protein with peptidoglycan-binding domain
MPDVDEQALAQAIDPEAVNKVQQNLQALHEYQGEVTGKLDRVTLNAIQAFQRAHGLEDDGIVDARTRQELADAADAVRR